MDMMKRRSCTSHGCEFGRHIRYDRGPDEPLSIAAATALAEYHGEDVMTASTQLYEFIDPEALDALCAETCTGSRRSTGVVEFEADGVRMTIEPDCIEVVPAE